jgi:hypothetical protein
MQPLDLTLTADQVNIEYGSSFNPMEYVQSYTQDSEVELILPDPLDTNALGKKELLYKLKNSKKGHYKRTGSQCHRQQSSEADPQAERSEAHTHRG